MSTLKLETSRPRTALIAFDQSLKHIGAAQELETELRHWLSHQVNRDIIKAARVAEAYRFLFWELKTEFPSQLA
jgi:hypothetical protein